MGTATNRQTIKHQYRLNPVNPYLQIEIGTTHEYREQVSPCLTKIRSGFLPNGKLVGDFAPQTLEEPRCYRIEGSVRAYGSHSL